MSRLTIDMTPQQHQALKAMAALEGKTIKQYTLERLFPRAGHGQDDDAPQDHRTDMTAEERTAYAGFRNLIEGRIAQSRESDSSIDDVFDRVLHRLRDGGGKA